MCDDEKRDPGAYIGREPELAAETIPGGIGPDDERVAAGDTRFERRGSRERPRPGPRMKIGQVDTATARRRTLRRRAPARWEPLPLPSRWRSAQCFCWPAASSGLGEPESSVHGEGDDRR